MNDYAENDWALQEPPEAYDEYDRVHAYDDNRDYAEEAYNLELIREPDPEPDWEPNYIRPDEDAIMDRYEAQFYGEVR